MLKLPLWTALAILAALLARGEQTPTPEKTEAIIPDAQKARTRGNTPRKHPTRGPSPPSSNS